jgi:hypothetical protein
MNVQITETLKGQHGFYVTATCGKTSAMVAIHSDHVQVICQNAAHKVWRGAGKFFPNAVDALANYRSSEMKAIIQSAVDFSQQPIPQVTH